MVRIIVAAFLGAAVLFVWGAVSWLFVPWHELRALPREDTIVTALRKSNVGTGVYTIPAPPEHDPSISQEARDRRFDEWQEKHREGPLAMLVYTEAGDEPLPFRMHVIGFGLYLGTALVAATMLAMAAPSVRHYALRVVFVLLIGLYIALGVNMVTWNYMRYPLDFSLQVAADSLTSALLLGLVVAAVVRPRSAGARP